MATTTNYGWTTPDDTALVKDGASAIRTLGSSVDTTTKALNPSTTLGDIEYRSSTANTNTRLGIGSSGQLLSVSGGVPAWTTVSTGGMTLINAGGTTLTGASVTISSIPQTYNHLQLVIRNFKPATDNQFLNIRINGDSGANRYLNMVTGDTNQSFAYTFMRQITEISDNTVATGLTVTDFYDYTNTTTWKMAKTMSLTNNATTTTNLNFLMMNAFYNQLDAISSLTFLCESGNMTSGTVYLYGVK